MENNIAKIKEQRVFFETLGQIYPAREEVNVSHEKIKEIDCYWFKPQTIESSDIIVYLHGGAFIMGDINSHRAMVSHVAYKMKATMLFIEYGLAPENPFPVGRNEVIEVYKELLISFPETNIILIGDSAGGGLTVSSVYAMIESELKLPARVMLISPWINLRCNTDSYESRKHLETILTKEGLLKNAAYYAGDNLKSADTSQLVFNSFPPVIILVGSNEILFDDSKNFYESIKAVQPNAQMKEYEGQAHVWMLTDIHSEAAKEALEDMNAFVRSLNH